MLIIFTYYYVFRLILHDCIFKNQFTFNQFKKENRIDTERIEFFKQVRIHALRGQGIYSIIGIDDIHVFEEPGSTCVTYSTFRFLTSQWRLHEITHNLFKLSKSFTFYFVKFIETNKNLKVNKLRSIFSQTVVICHRIQWLHIHPRSQDHRGPQQQRQFRLQTIFSKVRLHFK